MKKKLKPMKDYKLSEVKDICIKQKQSAHSCVGCMLEEYCDKYFGFSYSPSMWDIEEGKKDGINNK